MTHDAISTSSGCNSAAVFKEAHDRLKDIVVDSVYERMEDQASRIIIDSRLPTIVRTASKRLETASNAFCDHTIYVPDRSGECVYPRPVVRIKDQDYLDGYNFEVDYYRTLAYLVAKQVDEVMRSTFRTEEAAQAIASLYEEPIWGSSLTPGTKSTLSCCALLASCFFGGGTPDADDFNHVLDGRVSSTPPSELQDRSLQQVVSVKFDLQNLPKSVRNWAVESVPGGWKGTDAFWSYKTSRKSKDKVPPEIQSFIQPDL